MSDPKAKRCTYCGRVLPLERFSPCRNGRYGRYSRCKRCHAQITRTRRRRDPARVRKSHQAWRRRNKEVAAAAARRWKRKHPERHRAHEMVRAALTCGVLVRPDRCEGCRRKARVVAHHSDYARPLDVEWLCRACHGRRHVDLRLRRTTEAA
jgi:hypothetical protein